MRSKDRDVDPVGACVGMKGSRVQSIIRELRGEKIDIVEYSDDINTFVTNSLNPAKINRVQLTDPENRGLEVVVDDEQLSLAIGKKGQNVRLASRLVGWKIDIKSEQEKKREVEAEMERMARDTREMESLKAAGEKTLQRITEAGFRSLDAIVAAQVEGLTQVQGIGPKTAEKVLAAAQALLVVRAEREEAERQQREQEAAEAARRAEEEAAAQAASSAARAAEEAAEDAARTSEGGSEEPLDEGTTRDAEGLEPGSEEAERAAEPGEREGEEGLAEGLEDPLPAPGAGDIDSPERREDE